MPDHPTPLDIKTHSAAPVPFLIFDSRKDAGNTESFTEKSAEKTGIFIEHGPSIMDILLERKEL